MINNHFYSIHKFGGSSLANAERFMAVKSLLSGNEIVVASAIQGVTSALQSTMDEAKSSLNYLQILDELKEKHLDLLNELSLNDQNNGISRIIQDDFFKIQDILYAVYLTGQYSKQTQNLLLGYGELWSAMILKEFLSQQRNVALLDASKVLFVYEKEGNIAIDWHKSKTSLNNYLKNVDFEQLIITGFIASTLEGQRTTLGRNGSDFSAAIFANLFQAQSLTIWTDVDGIYTADPNLVRSATVIESLTYQEALELAYFGAKVLHPMTIAPLVEQKIPLYIKNSFAPQQKGTYISEYSKSPVALIKGISCITSIGLINIEGSGLISASGIASRVFDILYRHEIHVLFISQANSEHSLCFAVPTHLVTISKEILLERLLSDIERKHIKSIYADTECSILSIVGDNMVGTPGITSKLSTALAKANINIRAISQGSSERNISLIIKNTDADKAMQAVHSSFYLSRKTLSIGLIGPGTVGKSLLKQLNEAVAQLCSTYQINLDVRGIMNSQRMLLSNEAIDLSHWQQHFAQQAVPSDLEQFVQHITANNIPNAVIIDCTANKQVAQLYPRFMEKGIHVITPNKHANAGELTYYKKLQTLAKNHHYYFYEATVCAGLPVISTLQDLIKTGDRIEEIAGIFSGTLSYIFNEMGKGKSFSVAVKEAKELGFTEPDPREDLSGMDVARKLVCLAREMGHEVILDDVAVYDLVPPELKTCSVEEFIASLPAYDHPINHWLVEARSQNRSLHYVGTINTNGTLKVAIEHLPAEHPFSRLEGTDNMIIFRTKRYCTRPLIIQGPGAGAEVTAAGIFSDLLRLVAAL
ncbi:bifunctional aspartate kinase/homoserine dehydrogenase I [Legionella fallonii]|uniref:Bifunctional aspartokinase/homoserine dehydrogenase n=1 Tax=Legionella fallonii LLAP-10 TaxID=1212491 RepID=A0A098G657_9GAMM|nr:bifunctional aspartate kinase/homoserine dehydrogenase I [Legionella fallonii]CEG56990.1 Bifunctional aspartokinase/homoserine dehydrogenase 2, chloroplastic [Includes: Aspartokinase; Homoserine dehydrogenase] [Legionella fallonii LLAP-10]